MLLKCHLRAHKLQTLQQVEIANNNTPPSSHEYVVQNTQINVKMIWRYSGTQLSVFVCVYMRCRAECCVVTGQECVL